MTAPKYFSSNINLIYPSDSVQFTGVTSPYSSVCVGELIGGYAFNKWFDAPSDSAGNFIIDVNIEKPVGTYHLVAVPNSGFYCDSSQPSNEIALVVRERASPPGQIILNSVEWVTPSSLQSQIRLKITPNGAFQTFIKIDNDAEELVFVPDGTTTLVTTHNYSTYIAHNVCAGDPPNQCRTLNPIVPDTPCSPPGGVQRKCDDANTIAVWNQVNCRYDTAPCGAGNPCKNGNCVPDTIPTGCSPPCSIGTHCENNNCVPDSTTCTDYIAINKIGAIPTKEQTLQATTDYENGLIDKTCLLAIEDAYFASGDNLVPCSEYQTMRGIGQSITTAQLQQAQSDHAAGIIDDLCLNEIERLPVIIQDQNNSGVLIGIGAAIAALGVGYYITSKKRE